LIAPSRPFEASVSGAGRSWAGRAAVPAATGPSLPTQKCECDRSRTALLHGLIFGPRTSGKSEVLGQLSIRSGDFRKNANHWRATVTCRMSLAKRWEKRPHSRISARKLYPAPRSESRELSGEARQTLQLPIAYACDISFGMNQGILQLVCDEFTVRGQKYDFRSMNAVEARTQLVSALLTTGACNKLPAPERVYEEGDAVYDDEPLTQGQLLRLRRTQRSRERRSLERHYRNIGFRPASARRLARHTLRDLGGHSSAPTRGSAVAISARPRERRSVRRTARTASRGDPSEPSGLPHAAAGRCVA
jgi:hypothetical protein